MVPTKMKAWILTQSEELELKTVPVSVPEENQVLVKIDRACICNGSDPGIYHGHEAHQVPLIFGHEASGKIVKKGSAVTNFQIGDQVCWWFEGGAFAEYQTVTPENVAMFLVPETITLDQAPVMELVLASCRTLMRFPSEENRKRISICGLGPSGLILVQYAKALGYQQIIGWDLYESRRNLGKKLGAHLVYDPRDIISGKTGKIPESDIGVLMMGDDILPGEPTVTAFMQSIRARGEIVTYGHPEKGIHFSPYVFQAKDLHMRGPEQDMNKIREKGAEVVQMVADGKIQIEPLITHRIDFEDFLTAFDNILNHPEKQIKVIMKWRKEH